MSAAIRYLSLCGLLGYGYAEESLRRALDGPLDFIGVDGGSTDPGPYYLGSGKGFVKPLQVRRDLSLVLRPALSRGIPLIIGSAGGSGARPHVESTLGILRDLAREQGLRFRAAVVYADLDPGLLQRALSEGRLSPCGGAPPLLPGGLDGLRHPVAQFGTEPIQAALRTGAEVVVCGRCCDAAVFAAWPMMHGIPAGLALHAAKIAECGALCARPAGANDSLLVTLGPDSFTVEPPNPVRRCTPESVAAHSLYEQPDPECFYEPEGRIDMRESTFEPCGERGVTVRGTVLVPAAEPTLKLEGAGFRGCRAITVAGLRDPVAIAALDAIEAGVRVAVASAVSGFLAEGDYALRFLRYGLDAVTGNHEPPPSPPPREVGLLIDAVAPTQELADTLVSLARSSALHQAFPGRKATAGNLAFPCSPSDFSAGEVYEFGLYHLLRTRGLDLAFEPEVITIGSAP